LVSLLLTGGTACSPPDPCQGQSVSCLTLQVEAPGEAKADLVRAIYSLDNTAKQQKGFATAQNTASSFPIVFGLALGDGGNVQGDVIAELAAIPTMRGTISETLAPGEHKRIVVTLGRDVGKLPFVGPEPRYGAGLVALPAASPTTLVLFGGVVAGDQPLSDTWEYNLSLSTWQRSTTVMSPGPRQPQMVADPTSDRAVVVQGMGAGGVVQPDAWQYMAATPGDARVWTPLSTVTNPLPPRASAGFAIVPSMTGTPLSLFYGGIAGVGDNPRSDLWRMQSPGMTNFAGPILTTGAPVIKGPKLLATQTDVFLLGCDEPSQSVVKVWRLDNSTAPPTWQSVSSDSGAPSYRTSFSTAIDPATQRIVLFGGIGSDGALLSETYGFAIDSMSWKKIESDQTPPARIDASMTFAQGVLMLFGGRDSNLKQKGDNWKLVADQWKRWL
jgi:hypothetical protein